MVDVDGPWPLQNADKQRKTAYHRVVPVRSLDNGGGRRQSFSLQHGVVKQKLRNVFTICNFIPVKQILIPQLR